MIDDKEVETPGDKWADEPHYLKENDAPPRNRMRKVKTQNKKDTTKSHNRNKRQKKQKGDEKDVDSPTSESEFTDVLETWDPKVDKFKEKWEM